jgi:hypothetical protein
MNFVPIVTTVPGATSIFCSFARARLACRAHLQTPYESRSKHLKKRCILPYSGVSLLCSKKETYACNLTAVRQAAKGALFFI